MNNFHKANIYCNKIALIDWFEKALLILPQSIQLLKSLALIRIFIIFLQDHDPRQETASPTVFNTMHNSLVSW